MVRFVDEPYVTGAVKPKMSSVRWKMACGIGMTRLHFITLAENGTDLFDIYPATVFKQKRIRREDRVIIGVAESSKSARELIEKMIRDCLENCGDLSDVRGYFEKYIKDHI
ncbi:MAG: hypothetical protein K6G58_01855 [Lachnospiraceae bacterium]|nr:hypothetical protein [Lachnospiraceae bacterium]